MYWIYVILIVRILCLLAAWCNAEFNNSLLGLDESETGSHLIFQTFSLDVQLRGQDQRGRWRHGLISFSLLECWLLTSDLNRMTPPCSSCAVRSRFKGLLDCQSGASWGPKGSTGVPGTSGVWELPAGLSLSPQVHLSPAAASGSMNNESHVAFTSQVKY